MTSRFCKSKQLIYQVLILCYGTPPLCDVLPTLVNKMKYNFVISFFPKTVELPNGKAQWVTIVGHLLRICNVVKESHLAFYNI